MAQLVIRWQLNEVMARHHIKGKTLAEYLSDREATISKLRNSRTMPRIDGDRLDSLLKALNHLADPVPTDRKIDVTDLICWVEEDALPEAG